MTGISRRGFIGGAAAIGAAAGVGAAAGPSVATPSNKPSTKQPTSKHHKQPKRTGTIADVKHVVIVMQENRSFDHYYGSLGGVHGFADPSVRTFQNGKTVFEQPDATHSGKVLLPWHLDTKVVDAQDAGDLDHGWPGTHEAWDNGLWDGWVAAKSEQTMGYFTRADLPWQYALADAYTICDHYFCSIQGPTTPNRLFHWSGMIDPEGVNGGPTISNPADYEPVLNWKTYPERLQDAGVTWQVYSNDEVGDDGNHPWVGDYGDNPLWLFKAYHDALASSDPKKRELAERANVKDGWKPDSGKGQDASHVLSQFIEACKNNTVPTVSWIVAPYLWSEHPLGRPVDGAVYVQRVLEAIWSNQELWESTAVILNFDENDGYFDHVTPPAPPAGTKDEFVGGLPVGLGPRVPMMVVSPWSKGGWSNSQVFDHTSVLRFLERVTGVRETNISDWRRSVCGDLTSAFDFTAFDASIPRLPDVKALRAKADKQKKLPGATTPTGPQRQPGQESTSRSARRIPYLPEARVAVDRVTGTVTAKMTTAGSVAMPFAVYPNTGLVSGATPYLVQPGSSETYTWTSAPTDSGYDFSIYGPDGFVRRFAGSVVPASGTAGVAEVTSTPRAGRKPTLELKLANAGREPVRFTIASRDGDRKKTVHVGRNGHTTLEWPTDSEGRYDLTVDADSGTGFSYRFAGRISPA